MRYATFGIVFVGLPVLAFAQAQPCAPQRYAFDPYKPSDLAIVRQVGAGILAHAPLSSLLQLDPYVPTEAELLRQYGGALPVWPFAWYPVYPQPAYSLDFSRVCQSISQATTASAEPPITTFAELLAALERVRVASGAAPSAGRSVSAPAALVDRNTGVSIDYAGRTWVSAGRAVAFDDGQFVRVGELSGSPIFRRMGSSEEIIYVPTTTGMLAPFRATRR
jgi:hypothetical protein